MLRLRSMSSPTLSRIASVSLQSPTLAKPCLQLPNPTGTRLRFFFLRPLCVSSSSSASSPAVPQISHSSKCFDAADIQPYLSCCIPNKRLRVAVLLSGGVDSSVALRLLHAAGHSCTAFYLKIWFQVRFLVCVRVVQS
jgi:hypothetical protein